MTSILVSFCCKALGCCNMCDKTDIRCVGVKYRFLFSESSGSTWSANSAIVHKKFKKMKENI
jgi:hypothetical protein